MRRSVDFNSEYIVDNRFNVVKRAIDILKMRCEDEGIDINGKRIIITITDEPSKEKPNPGFCFETE